MRILIETTQLAGWGHEEANDLQFDGNSVVQEAGYFEAKDYDFFDRGLVSHTVSFSVARSHANIVACEMFCATHFSTVPKVGKITFHMADGTRQAFLYSWGSVKSKSVPFGTQSTTFYTLRTGIISTVKP